MQVWQELLPIAEVWFALAIAGALFIIAWRICRKDRAPLFPLQRHRAVPWGFVEIMMAIYLWLAIPAAIHDFLGQSQFYTWLYGTPSRDAALDNSDSAKKLDTARHALWSSALAFPLQLSMCIFVVRMMSHAEPYQMGLTAHRLGRNVVLGYWWWLALTPLVLGVNLVVELLITQWFGNNLEIHPIFHVVKKGPLAVEQVLILISAIVFAPLTEELMFRGILQPWLMRNRLAADVSIALAFATALFIREARIREALALADSRARWLALFGALAPALFVLALIPGYIFAEMLTWRWLPSPGAARAIYASSVMFSIFHMIAWPSPVALFFLALALGYLAYRTQSLVAPAVLHSLFNAVSCITSLMETASG